MRGGHHPPSIHLTAPVRTPSPAPQRGSTTLPCAPYTRPHALLPPHTHPPQFYRELIKAEVEGRSYTPPPPSAVARPPPKAAARGGAAGARGGAQGRQQQADEWGDWGDSPSAAGGELPASSRVGVVFGVWWHSGCMHLRRRGDYAVDLQRAGRCVVSFSQGGGGARGVVLGLPVCSRVGPMPPGSHAPG